MFNRDNRQRDDVSRYSSSNDNPRYDQASYASGYDYRSAGKNFEFGNAVGVELATESQAIFGATMRKVFLWMFLGLAITAVTSWFVATNPALQSLVFSGPGMIFLVIAQLGLAIAFGIMMYRVRPTVLKAMFAGYAFVLGLTLSSIFFVYELGTIFLAFGVSAAVFGVMGAVGYFIKKDLSPIGYVGYMLLFGAIIVTLINMVISFFAPALASTVSFFMNYVILAIFVGLTAFDMQRIKMMAIAAAESGVGTSEMADTTDRIAIYGAMQLYLDFINIFLRILAIMGRRKN